jgi:mannose-6-phosphate isomerase-like protein (cupin superfamily)
MQTRRLSPSPDAMAPDGSQVRLLAATAGGSMAHFTLAAGQTSRAIRHRTVEELWFVLAGQGQMWRSGANGEDVTALSPGLSLAIPVGTRFQFRATGERALEAVAVTLPPWPGDGEAEFVKGKW